MSDKEEVVCGWKWKRSCSSLVDVGALVGGAAATPLLFNKACKLMAVFY